MNPYQEKILKIHTENNGELPPFREIAKIIGVSSTNTVAYHVTKLKEKGFLSSANDKNGIVELNIKNLLNFCSKAGVYVLLKNKIPFYIGESENIKKHIIENAIGTKDHGLKELGSDKGKITIAYYFIQDNAERESLKNHLVEFYSTQGFGLL